MKGTADLRRRILSRSAPLGVIGQGYVGLSLACAAAEAGFEVLGLDSDQGRCADLASGVACVPGVDEEVFRAGIGTGRITFSSSPADLAGCDLVFVCVPTPLRDGTPDMSFVAGACRGVARNLAPGRLVVLESTTYPGTTDELVRPILEESGLMAGRDFLLAYSPERIDPGNAEFGFSSIPRIVGGTSAEATGVATLFYEQLVDKVTPVSSCRAAELSKLLENTYRHVNIALVNEMAMICHEMDIDVWEVIAAAATKPFGFTAFHPGPGVGGHCIPLDPAYLAWRVRNEAGRQFRLVEQAEDINAQMPAYVAARVGEVLNDGGKAVKGAKVLVLGAAYKPDVGDLRESPSLKAMTHLLKRGAEVRFHDPYVEAVTVNGTLLRRTELTNVAVASADCVVVITAHSSYDLEWVADHAAVVFDATNAYGPAGRPNVYRL